MKKKLLNQLRKGQPKGYAKTLADRCGCTVAQIGRIFDKSRPDNYGVIKEAIKLKKEFQLELQQEEAELKEAVAN